MTSAQTRTDELSCAMEQIKQDFTSGSRPRLKNVGCLRSLIVHRDAACKVERGLHGECLALAEFIQGRKVDRAAG